jgi:hypothetical protein
MIAFPALRRATTVRSAAPRSDSAASCEVCSAVMGAPHGHVIELQTRAVLRACPACAILFDREDSRSRFRTVPSRVVADSRFEMTAQRWAALGVPVGLALFVRRAQHVIACYPGPAGITEAELDQGAWVEIAAATPLAAQLTDDVEGLLVHRERGSERAGCFLIPITRAYELVGQLRTSWHGFSGGEDARRELAAFITELTRRGAR